MNESHDQPEPAIRFHTWRLALVVSLFVSVAVVGCRGKSDPKPSAPAAAVNTVPVWFEDVTDAVGLNFVQDTGPTDSYFMPQSMVGGCAMFDADGDGRLDLLVLQSAGPKTNQKNKLFLQTAPGRFDDRSAGSGLDLDGYNVGVAVGDVNNDGRPDVLITQFVGAKLFINLGGGKFRDVSAETGIDTPLWGASACFFDYDRDGWLDLVIVNYVDYDRSWPCTAPDGSRDFCGPRTFPGTASRLFHNRGARKPGEVQFEDVSVTSEIVSKIGPGLGVYCADLTGDDWPDILITNDGMPNHLWVNQKNGTFKEEGVSRGVAYTVNGRAYANMGIAVADYDGNEMLDLFVSHLSTETHTLWQQSRPGIFRDRTVESRLLQSRWRGTGFGTVGMDFDLDGWPDIALVNGRVYSGPILDGSSHLPKFWQPYGERNQLFQNVGGGKFEDVSEVNSAFCGHPNVARGLAVGDYDGDGRSDLLVVSLADRARLFRNTTTSGHWVTVKAIDPTKGGRDLYGTRVCLIEGVRRFVQVVQSGHSYLSSSTPDLSFGLGTAERYDGIQVVWPDGRKEQFPGGPANRTIVLRPGEGTPQ